MVPSPCSTVSERLQHLCRQPARAPAARRGDRATILRRSQERPTPPWVPSVRVQQGPDLGDLRVDVRARGLGHVPVRRERAGAVAHGRPTASQAEGRGRVAGSVRRRRRTSGPPPRDPRPSRPPGRAPASGPARPGAAAYTASRWRAACAAALRRPGRPRRGTSRCANRAVDRRRRAADSSAVEDVRGVRGPTGVEQRAGQPEPHLERSVAAAPVSSSTSSWGSVALSRHDHGGGRIVGVDERHRQQPPARLARPSRGLAGEARADGRYRCAASRRPPPRAARPRAAPPSSSALVEAVGGIGGRRPAEEAVERVVPSGRPRRPRPAATSGGRCRDSPRKSVHSTASVRPTV